jgi:hypothetical protein
MIGNEKVKLALSVVTHSKVKELLKNRSIDDNSGLPEIPSAQLWKNLPQEEKDELIAAVEKVMKWTTY